MVQIEIADDSVKIEILGWDKLWSFKGHFCIPLAHVAGVRRADALPKFGFRGLRLPGTHLPGVIVAGSYYMYKEGKWDFWCVHQMKKAIVLELQNEDYSRLFLEVEDPEGTVRLIGDAKERHHPEADPSTGSG